MAKKSGVATYFLAQKSGLFRPGAATILANASMKAVTKPKLGLRKEGQKKLKPGGGQSGLVPVLEVTGGGGGGAYVAKAVHFDGATELINASLTATDNGFVSFSYWFNPSTPDITGQGVMWVVDPEGAYLTSHSYDLNGAINTHLEDGAGTARINQQAVNGTIAFNGWLNLKIVAQTNLSVGNKIIAAYLGDTDVTGTVTDATASFVNAFNGLPFFVGGDAVANNDFIISDLADFWFAPGQFVDFRIEATRRKFIDADGKPVYLGATGELPTGSAPSIFFSGDATMFASNLGSGGSFAIEGALTNATTSPSDDNTAPHDMTISEFSSPFTTDGHIATAATSGIINTNVATVTAIDDEGNPLVYSITADDTGHITIDPAYGVLTFINFGPTLTPGDYSFTPRATDPGGLYVEQEFTITVTA